MKEKGIIGIISFLNCSMISFFVLVREAKERKVGKREKLG